MRVLYDHQIFQEQDFGGISRYFTEIYSNATEFDAEIAVVGSDNQHLLSLPEMRDRIRPFRSQINGWLWGLKFRGKHRLYNSFQRIAGHPTLNQVNLQNTVARLESSQFDVFHPTYYDPYFLEALGNRPFVLTVHDMIHEFFPENFHPEDSTMARKQNLCQRATRIIAVSNTTKNDLVECLGLDPRKIDVVYHGNSITLGSSAAPAAIELPERYVLFTGNRKGYKNFSLFVQAISALLIEDSSLSLVCTGQPFTAEEETTFEKLSISDRVLSCGPSDSDLAAVYAAAEIFVFPSLYEGFGMPILEAFACGCPVVLSDTPATREIAGDAAVFFHPKKISELKEAVSSVLGDRTLKNTLVRRAHKRAALFSWKKAASETAEVYRRALASTA